jgi:TetR/AcrR family transcriptional regulator, mexJK operon transcriptional repressor
MSNCVFSAQNWRMGATIAPNEFQLDVRSMNRDQHTGPRQHSGGETVEVSPRRGPGRQTPTATKQRNLELLDKALDLFLEQGFERTTIDAIAAAVGMAKRTVYLRYGNKTGLFKASLKRAIELWIVPVERLRAAETEDLEESLLRIGQILVANVMKPAGLRLLRITNAESGRLPEIGAFSYTQGTSPTIAYLVDFIRRRVLSEGIEIVNPEESAMAFLHLVVGGPANMTAWGLALSDKAIDLHTRYAVHLFLHGLLHRESAMTLPPGGEARSSYGWAALEEENRRLKLLLADSMLEIAALRDTRLPG